jgi:hypothetical protein
MKKILPIILGLLLCACVSKSPDGESSSRFPGVDLSKVPGTVVTHLPATSEHYLGSPCIVIMPNGKYVVSYDINSWDKSVPLYDKTVIFESSNKGKTWTKLTELMTQHWSTLFYHNNSLYIIGTYAKNNNAHIQKSLDGGKTWTSPHNENTGVLAVGEEYGVLLKFRDQALAAGQLCSLPLQMRIYSNVLIGHFLILWILINPGSPVQTAGSKETLLLPLKEMLLISYEYRQLLDRMMKRDLHCIVQLLLSI